VQGRPERVAEELAGPARIGGAGDPVPQPQPLVGELRQRGQNVTRIEIGVGVGPVEVALPASDGGTQRVRRTLTALGEAAPAEDDQTAKLQNLANLHAQGVLTDEEFAAAKAKALGI